MQFQIVTPHLRHFSYWPHSWPHLAGSVIGLTAHPNVICHALGPSSPQSKAACMASCQTVTLLCGHRLTATQRLPSKSSLACRLLNLCKFRREKTCYTCRRRAIRYMAYRGDFMRAAGCSIGAGGPKNKCLPICVISRAFLPQNLA